MRAGLATTVITPELPVFLAGYGDRAGPAHAVHDDLEARVLVLEARSGRIALVTCDLLALSRDFSQPIRAALAAVLSTSVDAVLTSCTHVHAGPSTLIGTDAIGWPVPDGYRDTVVQRVTAAAHAAMQAMAPIGGRFARVSLPADVAVNRRGHPLAPSAAVLTLDPVAVIANFGIHPTVTGPSNLAIATDWVGPFRRAVEAATGLPAIFLQGCQGDVNPAVTAWEEGDPAAWEPVVRAYADRLATCIAGAIDAADPIVLEPVTTRHRTARVPVGDTVLARLAGRARERAVELVDWTAGAVHVVAVPGEGFHGVEEALRTHHADPLLLAGLAPDWHGYLPLPYTDGYEEGLSLGPAAVTQLVDAMVLRDS